MLTGSCHQTSVIDKYKNWHWGPVKNETLLRKRWFKFSHCELSIYM